MKRVLVAYVPVLHQGYVKFFEQYAGARLYLPNEEVLAEFPHLKKDLRALRPEQAATAIRALGIFAQVDVVGSIDLADLDAFGSDPVIMPDEEECRALAARWLSTLTVEFDGSIFLRWDQGRVLAEEAVQSGRVVPLEGFVGEMMRRAFVEAEQATNLWRRVGAIITRDGEVLLAAHNTQVPSPRTPYYEGDSRMFFKRGLHFELTTDDHAERRLIAEAARRGIALEGTDLFVTTFPCPPCGKQVAHTGFQRCYFAEGYAVLDSERILRDNGVEIIRVEMKNPDA